MLLQEVIDIASYLFENKKSSKLLGALQAIVLYYVLIQTIFVIKPLLSFCGKLSCALAIYSMLLMLIGLAYLVLRERAKPDKENATSCDDIMNYLSNISWTELMGTTTITKEVLEKMSLKITELLVNKLNSISVSRAMYMITRTILSGSRILLALVSYALVWKLVEILKGTIPNGFALDVLSSVLEPSFRNLETGLLLYMLITLLISLITGLLSPLFALHINKIKNVYFNRIIRYTLAIVASLVFPYFALNQALNLSEIPKARTFTLLYKINSGDAPPNEEFLEFVRILFSNKDYFVYSPLAKKQIKEEDFRKIVEYQLKNIVLTTPNVLSSVYLICKRPKTIAVVIFTLETELKYNLKQTQRDILTKNKRRTYQKTVITDPKQIYLIKITEISTESIIQEILVQIGQKIMNKAMSSK